MLYWLFPNENDNKSSFHIRSSLSIENVIFFMTGYLNISFGIPPKYKNSFALLVFKSIANLFEGIIPSEYNWFIIKFPLL